MHGPIELTPELDFRATGKGNFRMIDQTQQLYNAAVTEAAEQAPHGETADVTQRHVSRPPTYSAQEFPSVESPAPSSKPIFVVAAVVIAFGLMLGVLFATVLSHPTTSQTGPRDLPPLISNADGLKGHLTLHWDEKLQYRLVVEPSDPVQKPEFSVAVSSPPRPLSVDIQLKDSAGTVLCSKAILLKFEPGQAAALAGRNARASESPASQARELEREHGQDVFQNNVGRDGQSESISVLGQLPCSMQAYQRTTSWSFSPDFLTLDQQAALLKRQQDLQARANAVPDELADNAYSTRKKAKKKDPQEFGSFAVEGDDELVGYDPSKGLIQTSARKTFIIERVSGDGNAARWGDVPANVHYKCDMNDSCTLTRSGAVLLYARLNR
jgi:hypothetical protein